MDVRLKVLRRWIGRALPWRKSAPEPPKVSRSELWSRVHDVLVKELQVASSAITPQADFMKDLGLDSLDLIELTMALEEEFGMEIQDEEAQKIMTIPQLLELLEEKMAHVDRSDR
jgi:acyl carrier protein